MRIRFLKMMRKAKKKQLKTIHPKITCLLIENKNNRIVGNFKIKKLKIKKSKIKRNDHQTEENPIEKALVASDL